MTDKPHILVVTRNLPPLIGGMERLMWHVVDSLRAEYQVHVVGPQGCIAHLPDEVTADEVAITPLPRFLLAITRAVLAAARRRKPALVFAGSGLVAPTAVIAAWLAGARSAVYLHGLDIEVNSRIYRTFWWPAFRRVGCVFVNSRFTASLAARAGIDAARIARLPPGVDLPQATPTNDLRTRYGLGEDPLILYVGRITRRKGLRHFVEHIYPRINETLPGVRLLVIGDDPQGAVLRESSERSRVEQVLHDHGLTEQTVFLGSRPNDDPELLEAYQTANVMVFPVQDMPYDNEGFGMVAIEAAANGLPTLAFAAGGVPDAVGEGISGHLLAPGDNGSFTEVAIRELGADSRITAEKCRSWAEQFAWPVFGRELCRVLKRLENR